ncbi:MAG TPA: MoaD/ThiS family protein [Candidatus Dormibacteraeota bacterium]|nr:MoaD/ThiS family protein [Candidatus Dormibacteraeota bacterium]
MSANVHLPAVLRASADGRRVVPVGADTVGGALNELALSCPQLERRIRNEQGVVRRHIRIYLEDRDIDDLQGMATPLPAGAQVHIIPMVSGGSAR